MNIGEYVIHNRDGICKVQDVVKMGNSLADKKEYFLLIPMKEITAKIYIPINNAGNTCRNIISKAKAEELLNRVTNIEPIKITNEKEREKIYREIINEGNLEKVIVLIVNIYCRKKERIRTGKKTTAVDEKYLKIAEHNLFSELGFALSMSEDAIKKIIESQFANE